jgi:hypothetical protein
VYKSEAITFNPTAKNIQSHLTVQQWSPSHSQLCLCLPQCWRASLQLNLAPPAHHAPKLVNIFSIPMFWS